MPREEAEQHLVAAGIDPQRRAETLSLDEWGKLSKLNHVLSEAKEQ